MARTNQWNHRGSASASAGATLRTVQLCVLAIVAAAPLSAVGTLLRADEIAPSELTVKTPGLIPLHQPAAPVQRTAPTTQLSTPLLPPPVSEGDLGLRNGPVVRLAQPITPVAPDRVVRRQSNQEPIPPGGNEYTRGTGVPPIGTLTINTQPPTGRLPEMVDRIASMESQLGSHEFHREWLNYSYFWEAPAFYNRPLYFQEVNLERYGYNWGVLQPVVSGAWFYVKIPLLPYMMTVHPPRECVYSLGYYRPGSCVPYQINWPEARLDAAIVEATFITGLCFLIP